MSLVTARDASQYTQRFHPGAYDFERFLDANGIKVGWTFRVQSRDFGWLLNDGTVCTDTACYRWWAVDIALGQWVTGYDRDHGTG